MYRTYVGHVQQNIQVLFLRNICTIIMTTKKNYRGLTLPESLVKKIESLIKRRKDLGYVSVSEFVKESVRRRVEEIESIEVAKNRTLLKK